MKRTLQNRVNISKVIGKGYKQLWNCKKRYNVVKGSRGSKKSTTIALRIVYNMMKMPLANTLVVRRVFNTHKDSTYSQLKWAVNKLQVSHLWHFSKSPLEITYKPTGQKILFRGLDNPMSITSITIETGHLCWCWWEEAFQITNENDFNMVDMSIRGELPQGYYKQHMISFNPWSEKHWIKSRFFDVVDDDIQAITTTYKCNEFLGSDDIALFDKMKLTSPKRYSIEGEGNWGISEGLIFDNWTEEQFNIEDIKKEHKIKLTYGMDFGFNDPTTLICVGVDEENQTLYLFDEHYQSGMTNSDIAAMLKYKEVHKYEIIGDSAEPKTIEELRRNGIRRIKGAKKGKDSIVNGIKKIQEYKIIVSPVCSNAIIELSNYVWDTKEGKKTDKPIDDYCHILDALRYSLEYLGTSNKSKVLNRNLIY